MEMQVDLKLSTFSISIARTRKRRFVLRKMPIATSTCIDCGLTASSSTITLPVLPYSLNFSSYIYHTPS